jgi:hypothetical protein|tara:strand:+ start:229 stop:408 length:180 start_codon:yes stop_codon:yes gene_type:complete
MTTKNDILKGPNKTLPHLEDDWKHINWDIIQRMRFMNADAEIPPEDSITFKKRDERDNT